MKAFKLCEDIEVDGVALCDGSIVLVTDDEEAAFVANVNCEEVADGTPISIPASRTEPV